MKRRWWSRDEGIWRDRFPNDHWVIRRYLLCIVEVASRDLKKDSSPGRTRVSCGTIWGDATKQKNKIQY